MLWVAVIWNAVKKAMSRLKDGFKFKIDDGESSFWYDSWVLKERLCMFFTWQAIHMSIPTRAVLHHRHVCTTDICPRCAIASESIEHCLFTCNDAASVWRAYGLHVIPNSSHGVDNFTWYKKQGMKHGRIFFIIMWVIWCARNEFIFDNHRQSVVTSVIKIDSLQQACAAAFGSTQTIATQSSNPRLVTWARPMEGTICLNVDGSLLGSLNSAGYGGLLRNHNGEFILGFYGTTSLKSILFAEIMAVLHGLTICWENGYRKINCLSDSLQLITRDWEVVLSHTLREGSSCADVLAKMGAVANTPLVTTSTPPRTLAKPLFEDVNGVIFTRE
ncbi:hypothetical protein TSUD_403620 [Trifolium subterraneum]|uniref:RNase H type-1 domain-containing protein n=1 Tax=Trifolium subterraneum TaxID=3900 RepID=A0A2Z6PLG9_TRISU|nr:hypothetical protein TSUD_403620 [Trifolium subterraneum]